MNFGVTLGAPAFPNTILSQSIVAVPRNLLNISLSIPVSVTVNGFRCTAK